MTSLIEQLRAAEEAAIVVSRPDLATLVVRGADRTTWLNGLLTCDLARAKAGVASYGLAVTQKGRILADVVVVVLADELRVVVPAARRDELRATFEKYLIMEDAELSLGDDVVAMAYGPLAKSLSLPNATVADLDELGIGGAVILAATAEAAYAAPNLTRGDFETYEALRVERGVPRFGADFDDTTYPQEATLEKRAVSFDKGCYLGQEVVCMLEMRGHVKRKLVRVAIDSSEVPAKGADVVDESGASVGTLTSATRSPESSAVVGLAMVKLAKAAPGTSLVIGGATAHVRA